MCYTIREYEHSTIVCCVGHHHHHRHGAGTRRSSLWRLQEALAVGGDHRVRHDRFVDDPGFNVWQTGAGGPPGRSSVDFRFCGDYHRHRVGDGDGLCDLR